MTPSAMQHETHYEVDFAVSADGTAIATRSTPHFEEGPKRPRHPVEDSARKPEPAAAREADPAERRGEERQEETRLPPLLDEARPDETF